MEVPISSGTTTLTWEYCPEELLRMIFKQLDYQSLISCMTVNKRWMDIVIDCIEALGLWSTIFTATMVNKGRTFESKSVLSMKDMWKNSMLWTYVPQAKIKLRHSYAEQNVKCIHVYKDTMIFTTSMKTMDRPIKYYNIPNAELMKNVASAVVEPTECRENDHMFVYFGHGLRAYGKETPEDTALDFERMVYYAIDDILLYRLEDNIIYIYMSPCSIIYALIWNKKKWTRVSRGRYYGNSYDLVCSINVFNDRVCLLTKLGFVLCEDPETRNYYKVNSQILVERIRDSTVLEMFDQHRVAVSVRSNGKQRVTACHRDNSSFMWLSCENMTCVTRHGAVLLIGFKDGAIAIYTPPATTEKKGQMNRLFNVKDFDSSIQQPAICALEVFEDTLSHHLLVVTRDKVLQLLITYPEHIRAYYE